jgi:hypothetical protein
MTVLLGHNLSRKNAAPPVPFRALRFGVRSRRRPVYVSR